MNSYDHKPVSLNAKVAFILLERDVGLEQKQEVVLEADLFDSPSARITC